MVDVPVDSICIRFLGRHHRGITMEHRETDEFDGMRSHIEDDSLWERTTSAADREAEEDDVEWDDEDDDVEWDDEDDEPVRKGKSGWDGDDGW